MILTERQTDDLVDLVRNVGAKTILPRFRNLADKDVEIKDHAQDLVTIADRTAEDMIRKQVAAILPGAAFVGEEAVSSDPGLLAAIGASDACVIVDPIDGTGNFVAGLSTFGMILAVVHRGQTVFGLLYDPVVDDWMYARRSEGAWFRKRCGEVVRIRTRARRPLAETMGCVAMLEYPADDLAQVIRGFDCVGNIRDIRCSCHEYRLLASGAIDFIRSYTLKPWDHAAGVLLTVEACGWAEVDGGGGYAPTSHTGRILAASCEDMGQSIAALAARMP